ncbi:MAG: hypothetical protein KAI81_09885 [Candidatus Marinimicrobia bacterium]|nr:hypothetical protein [Candidatus Neomarinimicrobiota bacterium]
MDEAQLGILTGMVATIAFFFTIGYYFYMGYKKKSLQSQQILAAIENGADLSSINFKEEQPNYLRRGLLLLFFGIALFIALWVQIDIQAGIWGLLFIGLGTAYLLVEKYENKNNDDEAKEVN